MTEEYRVEHDSMGDVRVPADAKWAAQTQRAQLNPARGTQAARSAPAAASDRVAGRGLVEMWVRVIVRSKARPS